MKEIMMKRTKKFAIDCWILCSKLTKSREYNAFVNQLIRCSSSVGGNYRASQRAKSTPDFINKLKIVEEESDESHYILELLSEVSNYQKTNISEDLKMLLQESNEITSIIVSAIKASRNNQSK